jgi:hypothetical protein
MSMAPVAELEPQFSSRDASATRWAEAEKSFESAELYWLASVRPDGRPHVTPLIAVWLSGAWYFCTGADERKAKNLEQNTHVAVLTGCNSLDDGLDLVIEGDAIRVKDDAQLRRIAGEYVSKYGEEWRFSVRDGAFHGAEGNVAIVFEVRPVKGLGFRKGDPFGQTRWRFDS